MNYQLITGGNRFDVYNECIKLLIHSARESDYAVEILGKTRTSPFSPIRNVIKLGGSSKTDFQSIILDFDGLVESSEKEILLSPDILSIAALSSGVHYWGMLGALFKIINDISPAYVTGYLLERSMKSELESFNQFSSQLPFALQVAINELITDID